MLLSFISVVALCVKDVVISCRRAVMALAVNPVIPYQLAVGCSDNWVRVYDQRMLGVRAAGLYSFKCFSVY